MKHLIAIASLLAVVPSVFAEPVVIESGDAQTALIELYTSEGCSSCPPAEAWVNKLKTHPDLWKRMVPVVFHVDYWDGLGWPDRFASAENTARQRRYAAAWRSNSVYTPGFVLNGREWRGWSQREALPALSSEKVGRLTLRLDRGKVTVSFTKTGTPDPKPSPLFVKIALLGFELSSDVKRGENRGRVLKHDFTVLQHLRAPLRDDGGRMVASLSLPEKTSDEPKAIAAWITSGEAQPPIQATGGWLSGKR